jgi:hypothetical protein
MNTLNAKRLRNWVKLFLTAESPINRRIKARMVEISKPSAALKALRVTSLLSASGPVSGAPFHPASGIYLGKSFLTQ